MNDMFIEKIAKSMNGKNVLIGSASERAAGPRKQPSPVPGVAHECSLLRDI